MFLFCTTVFKIEVWLTEMLKSFLRIVHIALTGSQFSPVSAMWTLLRPKCCLISHIINHFKSHQITLKPS